MDPRPLVFSIIIPAYNAERFLKATLASVGAQSCAPLEVAIVDDDTAALAAFWLSGRFGRLLCVEARARDLGVEASYGAFIAFLDADDVWAPAKSERQVAYLTA